MVGWGAPLARGYDAPMQVLFLKSKWEAPGRSLAAFLGDVRDDGFDGSELFLPFLEEGPELVKELHEAHGLELALAIVTDGDTPSAHASELERAFDRAARYQPILINGHVGRDIFPFEENVRLLERAVTLSAETGIPFVLETHRRRPTFSAPATRQVLDALPDLYLTLDVSHWMVVHESDLSDQEETLARVVERTRHVHARVGFEEGPQVPDPRAPEWHAHLRRHLRIWLDVVEAGRHAGVPRLCFTPEFGPPPYQHTLPYTRQPVADVWSANVAMRNMLLDELT